MSENNRTSERDANVGRGPGDYCELCHGELYEQEWQVGRVGLACDDCSWTSWQRCRCGQLFESPEPVCAHCQLNRE